MQDNIIDILEEEIYRLDPEVMERVLWDHSRTPDESLKNELNVDGHHHIYWATDNYENNGDSFRFFDEIQISSVTGKYNTLVRPRAAKSKEEQEKRTKDKAEVFTPSWVCNAQNNLVDDAWFGRKGVFNIEVTLDTGRHVWASTKQPIEFPEGKTWQDYVWDKRLEMACGEAPYLVSRYDTTTGDSIPLEQRIGLLDRKFRVISENVTTSQDWIDWGKRALKSTYGFEWQGDNLLLAREALLYSFIEYYEDFTERVLGKKQHLPKATLRTVAYIISWNIFQMDGILFTLPMSGEQQEQAEAQRQPSLFDAFESAPIVNDIPEIHKKKIYVKVAEWHKDGEANKNVHYFKDLK